MYIFVSPEWFSSIIAAITLLLAIATFIQACRTKNLTDVVDKLKNQAKQLEKQAVSLQKMVTLMAQEQITKHIPELSNATTRNKSGDQYFLELNHASAMIFKIINGVSFQRKILLKCIDKDSMKSPGEFFEFQVIVQENEVKKGERFEFFIHTRGALGMEFIQQITLIADKDHNFEDMHPVHFEFKFNYPMLAAQSIED